MQTRRELDRRPEATLPRESFSELLGQLANNSAALVRDEIELARQELSEKVSVLRSGILIVAVGSLIGLVAILTLTAAAVIGLAHYVGPGYAALIIGGTLALIGGMTAWSFSEDNWWPVTNSESSHTHEATEAPRDRYLCGYFS